MLPDDDVVNTTTSLATNKAGAIIKTFNSASIIACRTKTGGPDQQPLITSHYVCAPVGKISVKNFAKEAHIPKENPLAKAVCIKNKFTPLATTNTFVNVTRNTQSGTVEPSKCTLNNLKRSWKTKVNNSNNRSADVALAYRCPEMRKTGFTIDVEDFTSVDKFRVFKAKKHNAKRCPNILKPHNKYREQKVATLLFEREKFGQHRKLFKSRIDKLVEKYNDQQMESPSKIEGKGVGFPQTAKNAELKKEPGDTKKTRVPKRERFKQKITNRNSTRKITGRKCIREKHDTTESQGHMKNEAPKSNQNYSEYNVKNFKLVLSRKRVEEILDKTKLQSCPTAVSKQKIQLPFKTCSLTELLSCTTNNYKTFVDDTYFEIIEQLKLSENHLYYVNQNNVTTAFYMDYFPSFKKSVQLSEIRVVDKCVFDKFLSVSIANKNALLKIFCNANGNECGKVQRVSKQAEFCTFMNNFHLMQETVRCESNMNKSQQNYSITSKV